MDRVVALNGYLKVASGFSIEPGQFDCALFAAGWVDTIRDTSFVERFIGSYSGFSGGRKMLRAQGIRSLGDLARRELTSVGAWMLAKPGDIALIKENTFAFGIVGVGGHIHVVHAVSGLDVVMLDRAREVFRP